MARPKKCRKVCAMPVNTKFSPNNSVDNKAVKVRMTIDEYETIRLIDSLDLTQEECSVKMKIARTTVQSIYVSARKKLADCIVNGRKLEIEGGDYILCQGEDISCQDNCCFSNRKCRKTSDGIENLV